MKRISTDTTEFDRDLATGALVNINTNALEKRKLQKRKLRQEREEIDNIKKDVADIKEMLIQLIGKK